MIINIEDLLCLTYIFEFLANKKVKDVLIKSRLITGLHLFEEEGTDASLKDIKEDKELNLNYSDEETGHTYTLNTI